MTFMPPVSQVHLSIRMNIKIEYGLNEPDPVLMWKKADPPRYLIPTAINLSLEPVTSISTYAHVALKSDTFQDNLPTD